MNRNLLNNGDFSRGLYGWSGSGTVERTLGWPRLGCVKLADGQALSQPQGISQDALYTLHFFYRAGSAATLTAGYGDVTATFASSPASVWREGVIAFAVDGSETNGAVEFGAAGGTVYVDSVTLLAGGLARSRAELAAEVAARIADLAADAGLTLAADADGPEGDYTAAIDEALRGLGCVNEYGDPDVTRLGPGQINDALEAVRTAMLQRVRGKYALQTDVTLGPRSESLSQRAASLDEMIAGAGSDRRVKVGRLTHGAWRK